MQKSTDLRFLKKILTDIEIEQVRCASEPDRAIWSFWACKEAAYKVVQKQTGDAAFVPRRWSVHFRHPLPVMEPNGLHLACARPADQPPPVFAAGDVAISEKQVIPVSLFSSSSYVHCLAADQSGFLDKAVWRVEEKPAGCDQKEMDSSVFVRSCLVSALSAPLQADQHQIKIIRAPRKGGELGPPAVYLNDIRTDIDISLSHDGRFAAYAFLT
ncbi:MAG: 4'-phosphopantetheinyl transferase superfamily protein [Deltaproteobacteria bacterium]